MLWCGMSVNFCKYHTAVFWRNIFQQQNCMQCPAHFTSHFHEISKEQFHTLIFIRIGWGHFFNIILFVIMLLFIRLVGQRSNLDQQRFRIWNGRCVSSWSREPLHDRREWQELRQHYFQTTIILSWHCRSGKEWNYISSFV